MLSCSKKKKKKEKKCDVCGRTFNKTSNLKRHLASKTCTKNEIFCQACKEYFAYQRNYQKHKCDTRTNKKQNKNVFDFTPVAVPTDLSNQIAFSLVTHLQTEYEDDAEFPSMISAGDFTFSPSMLLDDSRPFTSIKNHLPSDPATTDYDSPLQTEIEYSAHQISVDSRPSTSTEGAQHSALSAFHARKTKKSSG